MSKALNRPMFRRGGPVDSRGKGITSGLDTPKRGVVDGPGKYSQDLRGIQNADSIDLIQNLRQRAEEAVPMAKPEFTVSDFLRLAGRGFELAGAPSQGKGIKGLIATAAPTLGKIGGDIAGSLDKRMATAKASRDKKVGDIVTTGAALEVAKIKANKPFETQFRAEKVSDYYDGLIEAEQDQDKKDALMKKKETDVINIYKKFNVSKAVGGVYSSASIEKATELATNQLYATKGKNNPNYVPTLEEIQPLVSEYLKKLEQGVIQQGSEMDREDMALGGISGQEQSEKPMPLTYDELKARLKGQVSDDIVRLLSQSYEALADFSEITTQADVNSFNQKYQVELVLPQTQES